MARWTCVGGFALLWPLSALAVLWPLSAAGAEVGNPEEGRALARTWCQSCHLVEPSGSGPDAAPPFATIANDRERTDRRLRVWLADPHPPMPNLKLGRQEIEDLVAYIGSLRRK